MKLSALRKLCLAGVISPVEYWQYKIRRKQISKKVTHSRSAFDLSNFTDDECLLLFRFTKLEIHLLVAALEIPAWIQLQNRNRCKGIEGLCILLRRLSYPNRFYDLVKFFNRDVTTLSRFSNSILKIIFEKWGDKLATLDQPWLTRGELESFSESCSISGSYYANMVGFIDGTARPICRPKYTQREQYSGYKKLHCLKYQSIVFPNGLIGRLDGPFNGRRHDAAILALSNLKAELRTIFQKNRNENFCLYADPGYSNQKFIKTGFRNSPRLTPQQQEFNAQMSALRVSVEYGFGKVVQQFAFLDFKKNQKLYLQHLKEQYHVAALLVNCQTCMRGNQVSKYFCCMPPSLQNYLQK